MGFALQVAARLLRREGTAPRGIRIARVVGPALVIVGGSTLALLGSSSPIVLALIWLAGLTGLLAGLAGWLRPLLVVAVFGLALGVASLFVVLGVASGVEQELIRSMARLNG